MRGYAAHGELHDPARGWSSRAHLGSASRYLEECGSAVDVEGLQSADRIPEHHDRDTSILDAYRSLHSLSLSLYGPESLSSGRQQQEARGSMGPGCRRNV